MKSIKTIAVGACALVALSAGISSATAAAPAKSDVQTRTGSCAVSGTPGEAAIAGGVAKLTVPDQMSWAQVRTFPQGLKLSTLKTLKFDSNSDTPGVVWAKITTDHGEVVYSPNTQTGGETGLGTTATHNVLAGTVRYNDDAGFDADVTWKQLLAQAGTDKVATVSVTAGCANPVGPNGAHVQVDNLTLNSKVIRFNN